MRPFNRRSSFSDQISGIEFAIKSLSEDVVHEEKARKKLLTVCQGIVAALESPAEYLWRMIMQVRDSVYLWSILTVPTPQACSECVIEGSHRHGLNQEPE